MKFGDKKVRYAVLNGREVIGAKLNGETTMYEKPIQKLAIKNNGSTDTGLVVYDAYTKDGSFIVKDKSNTVTNFDWILTATSAAAKDGTTTGGTSTTVPANATIYTHEQTPITCCVFDSQTVTSIKPYPTLAYIPNGNFEITDWSQCENHDLDGAFCNSSGLKKVPNKWPENCKSLRYALFNAGVTELPPQWNSHPTDISFVAFNERNKTALTTIPPWDGLDQCENMFCAFEHNQNIQNFSFEGLADLGSKKLKNCSWCFNDCIIKQDLYDQDAEFLNVYRGFKNVPTARCFWGDASRKMVIKYEHTTSDGELHQVCPSSLLDVPQEFGGARTLLRNGVTGRMANNTTVNATYIQLPNVIRADDYPIINSQGNYVANAEAFTYIAYVVNEGPLSDPDYRIFPNDTTGKSGGGRINWWNGDPIPVLGDYIAHVFIFRKEIDGDAGSYPTWTKDNNYQTYTSLGGYYLVGKYDKEYTISESSET